MLGVYITINGVPVYARTAVNRGLSNKVSGLDPTYPLNAYEVDDGSTVYHDPKDGAVTLAKKLLDTIKEQEPHEQA